MKEWNNLVERVGDIIEISGIEIINKTGELNTKDYYYTSRDEAEEYLKKILYMNHLIMFSDFENEKEYQKFSVNYAEEIVRELEDIYL